MTLTQPTPTPVRDHGRMLEEHDDKAGATLRAVPHGGTWGYELHRHDCGHTYTGSTRWNTADEALLAARVALLATVCVTCRDQRLQERRTR